MYHNSFSFIDDFDKAQKIADDILNKEISSSFDGMIKKVNVHLPVIEQTMGHSYYWCLDQYEFATDINFKKREDLSIIYKKLVELNESDLKLFKEISDGCYLISGFNNKLLRKKLYEYSSNQKNINRMTRRLAKLRNHEIIKKVARKTIISLQPRAEE